VKDQLNLVFNKELEEPVSVKIVNAVGETRYSNIISNGLRHTIDMSGMPNGLYLIKISGTNIDITKHIIK
jgi:hypothetical protein